MQKNANDILAALRQEQEDTTNHQPDQDEQNIIHVYPVEGGGVLFSKVPLDTQPTIIESKEPETDTRHMPHKEPLYFLHFLFILFLFIALDNADTFFLMFSPTVTVTITPQT